MVVAAANVRGTAIKIGNLPGTRSISAGAQLDATAARLRKAEASGDAIEILASMQAATALELPQGVNLSPEVVDAMRDLRRLINSDPALRRPAVPGAENPRSEQSTAICTAREEPHCRALHGPGARVSTRNTNKVQELQFLESFPQSRSRSYLYLHPFLEFRARFHI